VLRAPIAKEPVVEEEEQGTTPSCSLSLRCLRLPPALFAALGGGGLGLQGSQRSHGSSAAMLAAQLVVCISDAVRLPHLRCCTLLTSPPTASFIHAREKGAVGPQ
jgi:hypothetical protein